MFDLKSLIARYLDPVGTCTNSMTSSVSLACVCFGDCLDPFGSCCRRWAIVSFTCFGFLVPGIQQILGPCCSIRFLYKFVGCRCSVPKHKYGVGAHIC